MTYSRDILRSLEDPSLADHDLAASVASDLFSKIHSDCESLSIAEKDWMCRKIQILHTDKDGRLDPFNFPCCADAMFNIRYILYFNNIEGWYPAYDWNGEISHDKKERDLTLLNHSYVEWKNIIERTNHTNDILRNTATETRHHLKEIGRFCKQTFAGYNRKKYLEKSIILHSKYMHRMVLSFYEENPIKENIPVDGKLIRIDSFSYVHILFRHYSKLIKEYQIGKSYHDEVLDYKNLPLEIKRILNAYSEVSNNTFDGQKVYFYLEEKLYAIWFRPIKTSVESGQILVEHKVQTMYPVEDPKELERAKSNFPKEVESKRLLFILKET